MAAQTFDTTPSLLDALRQREAQARAFGACHLAAVPDENSMLFWLARAAASVRTGMDRKQVHVAASLNKDQSTIARFEKGLAWPRDPDQVVDAYADDLEIDSIALWEEALRMWKDYRAGATPAAVADVVDAEVQRADDSRTRREPARRKSRQTTAG